MLNCPAFDPCLCLVVVQRRLLVVQIAYFRLVPLQLFPRVEYLNFFQIQALPQFQQLLLQRLGLILQRLLGLVEGVQFLFMLSPFIDQL